MDFIKEIDAKMFPIQYGWVDSDGGKHIDMAHYAERYMLQMPDQLLESRLGVCWDQVELQRKLFSDISVTTRSFFIVHYDEDKCPTHTFTIFEYDNKIFWYEHAWATMRGLHEYDNLKTAISDIRNKFIDNELTTNTIRKISSYMNMMRQKGAYRALAFTNIAKRVNKSKLILYRLLMPEQFAPTRIYMNRHFRRFLVVKSC